MTGREISTINESGLNFEIEPTSLLYKQKDLSPTLAVRSHQYSIH
jgi:hypothetical protein